MTYHVGVGPGMRKLGLEEGPPHFTCDECGAKRDVKPRGAAGAPQWFLDGKAPPGWVLSYGGRLNEDGSHDLTERRDICPRCK